VFNPTTLDANNPSPMTGAGNNTYLIAHAGGGAALIDAGVGEPRHLHALASRLAIQRARLEHVLVTHGHADHASGAASIAALHPDARCLKAPWPEADVRSAVTWWPLEDGDRIQAGSEILTTLRTPGHSPDHVAFWHEHTGTVFTGDLVVQGGSVMIQFSRGGDLGEYLFSLDRLLGLRPARLLPAHGPEIDDPGQVLRATIEHRLGRERQVVSALAAGRDTVPSIAESIYDGLAPALMPAAHETVRAHLEKLRREGRAVEEGGVWRG
jgi:glyoxylase-like metal-dependent hydrolase (beta-lactamase superfamily II)